MARRVRTNRVTSPGVATAPFTIVIDTREQRPWSFTAIKADHDQGVGYVQVTTQLCGLPAGDYSLVGYETNVAVERKSLADLFSTMGQGRDRFVRELERLADYRFAAVVIEEEWSTILLSPPPHTMLSPKTVLRSVLAWQQRYPRIHWWACPGRDAAERIAYRVLERFWKEREKERDAEPATGSES